MVNGALMALAAMGRIRTEEIVCRAFASRQVEHCARGRNRSPDCCFDLGNPTFKFCCL